jgi:Cu/Ag efflux pump CusA
MSLSSISLQRPVLAIVMSIVIVLFGALGYNFLGVREYPAIDPPIVTVRTSYTGANAEIIESQITEPLEKAINGIAGVKNISSSSNLGSSSITVEFNLDIEMEQAAADVRDKVSQAIRQLPQDIDAPPVISKADASGDFLIIMPIQSRTRNMLEVTDYATNVILEKLQTIPVFIVRDMKGHPVVISDAKQEGKPVNYIFLQRELAVQVFFFTFVLNISNARSAHPSARLRGCINKSLAYALCCAASG